MMSSVKAQERALISMSPGTRYYLTRRNIDNGNQYATRSVGVVCAANAPLHNTVVAGSILALAITCVLLLQEFSSLHKNEQFGLASSALVMSLWLGRLMHLYSL